MERGLGAAGAAVDRGARSLREPAGRRAVDPGAVHGEGAPPRRVEGGGDGDGEVEGRERHVRRRRHPRRHGRLPGLRDDLAAFGVRRRGGRARGLAVQAQDHPGPTLGVSVDGGRRRPHEPAGRQADVDPHPCEGRIGQPAAVGRRPLRAHAARPGRRHAVGVVGRRLRQRRTYNAAYLATVAGHYSDLGAARGRVRHLLRHCGLAVFGQHHDGAVEPVRLAAGGAGLRDRRRGSGVHHPGEGRVWEHAPRRRDAALRGAAERKSRPGLAALPERGARAGGAHRRRGRRALHGAVDHPRGG